MKHSSKQIEEGRWQKKVSATSTQVHPELLWTWPSRVAHTVSHWWAEVAETVVALLP